ncbi:MAG: hypothetical protein KAH44_02110, partial [Oricola sp.]|nr:hypothetical protein [Oricola sp.]
MKAAAAVASFFAPSAPVSLPDRGFTPANANNAAPADLYFETGSAITLKDRLFLRGRAGLRFHIDVVHAAGRASAMFTASAGGLFDFVGLEVAARGFFEDGGPACVRFEGTFADGRVIAREAEVYRNADDIVVFGGFSRLVSLRVFADAAEGAPWSA